MYARMLFTKSGCNKVLSPPFSSPDRRFRCTPASTLYLTAYLCIYNLRIQITIIFENNFPQLHSFFHLNISFFSLSRSSAEKLCSTTACSAWIFNALFHGCFATMPYMPRTWIAETGFLLTCHLLNSFSLHCSMSLESGFQAFRENFSRRGFDKYVSRRQETPNAYLWCMLWIIPNVNFGFTWHPINSVWEELHGTPRIIDKSYLVKGL